MRNAECGMRNAEIGVWSAECGVRNLEFGIWNLEFGMLLSGEVFALGIASRKLGSGREAT